jgi:hypothetical protein
MDITLTANMLHAVTSKGLLGGLRCGFRGDSHSRCFHGVPFSEAVRFTSL